MRFSPSFLSLQLLQQQQRWQIKFMISKGWLGCCKEKPGRWSRKRSHGPRPREYGIEHERRKAKKGFWQIDCQAETEMAQEHHKNKFAIIHFDLSLGMRIEKASQSEERKTHTTETRTTLAEWEARKIYIFIFFLPSYSFLENVFLLLE